MRILVIALGRVLIDLRLAEPPDDDSDDDDQSQREGWPLDSNAVLTESHRVGYIDDPGRDTQPW